MRKASHKPTPKQSGESPAPQDALYLAIFCYHMLIDDQSRPAQMKQIDCAKLVIQHMDVVLNQRCKQTHRWFEGDDTSRDEDSILNAKIGMPKRDASSLMIDIASTIERAFSKDAFSLPKLVKAMKERGLPCLPNETAALAEEITVVAKALGNDKDDEKEQAIVIWNSNTEMTKKQLERQVLGGNYNERSFFKSVKEYSDNQYGKGHLRKGKTGSRRIDRE